MKYLMPFIVFVSLVFFASQAQANRCVELVQKQEFYEAADVCGKLAGKGDSNAQFAMGVLSYQGNGMMSDLAKSQQWMRKAAQQNHQQAQFNLGIMLANGQGSQVNLVEAYAWLKIASDNGYTAARDSVRQLGAELSSSEKKQAEETISKLKTDYKL